MCIYIYIMFICVSIDIITYLYTILYDICRSQYHIIEYNTLSLCGSDIKASAYNVGDPGSILESGGSPGEGNGNLLQYSCLENPMDGGAW